MPVPARPCGPGEGVHKAGLSIGWVGAVSPGPALWALGGLGPAVRVSPLPSMAAEAAGKRSNAATSALLPSSRPARWLRYTVLVGKAGLRGLAREKAAEQMAAAPLHFPTAPAPRRCPGNPRGRVLAEQGGIRGKGRHSQGCWDSRASRHTWARLWNCLACSRWPPGCAFETPRCMGLKSKGEPKEAKRLPLHQ